MSGLNTRLTVFVWREDKAPTRHIISKRHEKEYEDAFAEDLETAFLSHTTGSSDNPPEPRRHGSLHLAKRQKRTGQWRARKNMHESRSHFKN